MSCDFFILTKSREKKTDDNTENQIISWYPQNTNTYILPANNIVYYIQHGLFEANLIQWTKEFCSPEKTFLDIGAHSGTYSISLADHCKTVYAFEPQRMTYYSLCGSVALSNKKNIHCFQCGLGSPEQVGKQVLRIVSPDGGGSTLIPANGQTVLDSEVVNIQTMDNFNFNDIGFIKMDVEDNELNVLRGAVQTLQQSNYPPILFECNHLNQGRNASLFEFLENMGYAIQPIRHYSNMFLATHPPSS